MPPSPDPDPDPFDTLLALEDDLYTTAYALGTQDGAHAGRIEGRIFGLEKGFEKFAALGELHGRAAVWGARMSPCKAPSSRATSGQSADGAADGRRDSENENIGEPEKECALPPIEENERLRKHIQLLHALTDPATFSTLNTEGAVADFDDRFKRAGAKAKIIERMVGESATSNAPHRGSPEASGEGKKRGDDSMEDFSFEVTR